ncbi:MAG: radical SAM protein [Nitrospirae bacterium]|nr:radical SAM protein [Nitrospirota bacterium]
MFTVSVFLTQKCDNNCSYCYGHAKGEMSYGLAREVITHLHCMGFRKISFAGGEPLLWSYDVFEIIGYAKSLNMYTELITNGNKLQSKDLTLNSCKLDILTIDVDCLSSKLNTSLGKNMNHVNRAEMLFSEAHRLGIQCKVNTVVTSINYNDVIGMCDWIKGNPAIYRWKIFQFLPSAGRALKNADQLMISDEGFNKVVEKVREEMEGWQGELIIEDNEYLSNSYASVDQECNFYTALKDGDRYKTVEIGKVLDMSMEDFLNHPLINRDQFLERSLNNYKKMITMHRR